jgi:hypothetical protein
MKRRTVQFSMMFQGRGLCSLLNISVALTTVVYSIQYLSLPNAALLVRAIIIILTRRREEGIGG